MARAVTIASLITILLVLPVSGQEKNKLKRSVDPARVLSTRNEIAHDLRKVDAREAAEIVHIKADSLAITFPQWIFFAVRYPQYPIPQSPPNGMKVSTLFAFSPEGKRHAITDDAQLGTFFKVHFRGNSIDRREAFAVIDAWLALASELQQDGPYHFIRTVNYVDQRGEGHIPNVPTIIGSAIVINGGKGRIEATIDFDYQGQVQRVVQVSNIRPRPYRNFALPRRR